MCSNEENRFVFKPCNKKRVEAAVASIKRTCYVENFNFNQASVYTLNFVNIIFFESLQNM